MWAIDADKNEVYPEDILARDQKCFKFTTDYELRLFSLENVGR